MKPLRSIAVLFVSASVILATRQAPAETPDLPKFEEQWYVVKMLGQHCGHMHSIMKRVGDQIHTSTNTQISLKRGPTPLEITMAQSFRESIEGQPLGFHHETKMGKMPETITGVIKDNKVKLVEKQMARKHESEFPFDPGVRFAWGQMLEQKKRGLEPGTTYKVKGYEPSVKKEGPIEMEFEVIGKESATIDGVEKDLFRIRSSLLLQGMKIDSSILVDDNHVPQQMTVNMGMLKMVMQLTTKEKALKRGAPPEMFLESLVSTNKRVGTSAKEVKLRLKLKDGIDATMPDIPETARQKVKRVSEREAIVTITRDNWEKARSVKKNNISDDQEAYLAASHVCDAKDRKIRRMSRKAVKGCDTPAEQADALRKAVTREIKDKGMSVAFATASEVVRKKAGDCTEHGVLLAAVARAAGLPARGVSGLVEVPRGSFSTGSESAFGYHMWTQVYIGDEWVDVDAALRQTDCDVTHISLAMMPLGDEGLMGPITALIPLMGQLNIEVLEVKK